MCMFSQPLRGNNCAYIPLAHTQACTSPTHSSPVIASAHLDNVSTSSSELWLPLAPSRLRRGIPTPARTPDDHMLVTTRQISRVISRIASNNKLSESVMTLACIPCIWVVAQSLRQALPNSAPQSRFSPQSTERRQCAAGQDMWTQHNPQLRLSLPGVIDRAGSWGWCGQSS